jgi:hypothetical protein
MGHSKSRVTLYYKLIKIKIKKKLILLKNLLFAETWITIHSLCHFDYYFLLF